MQSSRRTFLSVAGSSAIISLAPSVPLFLRQAAAAESSSEGDNILVIVQLSGGNDGLNTIIPYADDMYAKNRFSLRYGAGAVRKIDDYLGFHPAMTGMAELLEEGQLAIVQGVGYENPNRSHFESMDIWHTARQQLPAGPTGWLGRSLDQHATTGGDLPALHLGGGVRPLALAGEDVQTPSVRSIDGFRLETGGDSDLARAMRRAAEAKRPEADDLLGFLHANTSSALAAAERIRKAAKNYQTPVSYPGNGLGQRLKGVAQLINAGMKTRVYYLTLDGFDTHSNQRDAHAALLGELSTAVHAFMKDIAHHGHGDRVMLMTFSEFGRRVKENASTGTDHGAAAPMLLAGPRLKPGPFGKHPSLTDLEDGDIKFHTDFRQVYAAVMRDWLAWNPEPVLGKQHRPIDVFAS